MRMIWGAHHHIWVIKLRQVWFSHIFPRLAIGELQAPWRNVFQQKEHEKTQNHCRFYHLYPYHVLMYGMFINIHPKNHPDARKYMEIYNTWSIWVSSCLDLSWLLRDLRKNTEKCGKNKSWKLLATPKQTLHPCWLPRQISGLLLWHEVNFSEHKAKLGTHGPVLRQTHQRKDPGEDWWAKMQTWPATSSNMFFPKLPTANDSSPFQ